MTKVISVEHLTKEYQLGVINSGTLANDLNKWWARWRGKPDPYAKIGQADHGNHLGDSILALDDVSFSVEQGEVLGIIGKNGAGKSTLLKILSQVTAPTSGVVKVMGRIGSLLEVGTGFHPELTGRENVYLNGAILGMGTDEVKGKFDEIVDFSGVEKFIDTPVKRYSSGMYVRLAFAVAAHLDPEILVVDEVLAVGDAEFQKKCLGKMDDVAGEGRTVMFVSHNMGSVKQLCEKSLLLKNGSIEFLGSTKSAIDKYLHTENTNNSGNLLLKKHQGSGEIKFTSIRFLKDGKPTKTIFMGDPLEIEIEYTVYSSIKKPIIGILIQDNIGRTVLRAYSRESKPNFIDVMNKDGTIHCKFDNLPLMSGKYFVRLWLGYMRHNVIDDVHQSASFDIIENDVYNTGVIPDTNNGGLCYVNHTWKITE